MSDMKCPFCNKPLQPTLRLSDEYWCENYDCPRTSIKWTGSQKLWQELIRTRKALEIAVVALNKYTDASGNWWYGYEFQGHYEDYAGEYADKALEQITALEQKDK